MEFNGKTMSAFGNFTQYDNSTHRVGIFFDVDDPNAVFANKTFAELKTLIAEGAEIVASLELHKDETQYLANTQTIYNAEDMFVRFDFAGLGIMEVDSTNVWSFTEHTAGGGTVDEERIVAIEESIGDIETALDSILAIQNELMGGGGEDVNLITFTIDGTEYQAEQGMTWGEFVASDYNPDFTCEDCGESVKFFKTNDTKIEFLAFGSCWDCTSACPMVFTGDPLAGEGELVTHSDAIIHGHCYVGS